MPARSPRQHPLPSTLVVWLLAFAPLAAACGESAEVSPPDRDVALPAVARDDAQGDDLCAPGRAPNADDDPHAPCAELYEPAAADLTDEDGALASSDATSSSGSDSGLGTKALRPLTNGAARPSCAGKSGPGYTTCGPSGASNCCASLDVPGGKAGALSVAPFDLGAFEVTVARFESFVASVGGNLRAAAEDGRIPGISAAHRLGLPRSRAELDDQMGPSCVARSNVADFGARTWPSQDIVDTVNRLVSDDNPRAADIRADATAPRLRAKPVNCVTYYLAEAFCAWDGGRLPTNDEWRFAAEGGAEQRTYPWGSGRTADKLVTDLRHDSNSFTYPEDFPYFANGMNAYHIAPPGRKPAGVARWGHFDMGGNVLEWMAEETSKGKGIVRGGSWEGHRDTNSYSNTSYLMTRSYGSLGIRCAYGAPPAPPPAIVPTVAVYRGHDAKKGDHLLGTTRGEGAPAYADEGLAFKVFATAPPNGKQIFRCRRPSGHHHLSTAGCGDNVNEGVLGYVSREPFEGARRLYRCRAPGGKDILSTIKVKKECEDGGYVQDGTQGYVGLP